MPRSLPELPPQGREGRGSLNTVRLPAIAPGGTEPRIDWRLLDSDGFRLRTCIIVYPFYLPVFGSRWFPLALTRKACN